MWDTRAAYSDASFGISKKIYNKEFVREAHFSATMNVEMLKMMFTQFYCSMDWQ